MIRHGLLLTLLMSWASVYAEQWTVSTDGQSDFTTIQAAIDAASSGDTIWVADGVYTGINNVDLDPEGKAIYLASINGPNHCIIDCQGSESHQHRAFLIYRSETADTVIDGFTLTGGWATATNQPDGNLGGAFYCVGSSPIIRHCIFTGNYAGYGGAAALIGESTPRLENCTFQGNVAENQGGALRIRNGCQATLVNCIVWNNQSLLDEANEILVNNSSGISDGELTMDYCIVRNQDNALEGTIQMDTGDLFVDPCFVEPGTGWGDTWIPGDLHIQSTVGRWDDSNETWVVDPNQGPGIDAGDPNLSYLEEYWPNGRRINIGAYGGLAEASLSQDANGIGDLNGDQSVDLRDLAILADHWLQRSRLWVGDMVQDGVINLYDFSALVLYWEHTDTGIGPLPDPPQWLLPPALIEGVDNAITMTAAQGQSTDGTGVEYWFQCTSPDPNIHSGWLRFDADQPATWEVNDLAYNQPYFFYFKARNIGNQKVTKHNSLPKVVVTGSGYDSQPSEGHWTLEPNVIEPHVVYMKAAQGSDDRGSVEYKFTCAVQDQDSNGVPVYREVPAYSSDWQTNLDYQVTITQNGIYWFNITLRDNAGQTGLESPWGGPIDLQPPTWDPNWVVYPHYEQNLDSNSPYPYLFTMTVHVASDTSGVVQYLFECVNESDYSSGWLNTNVYSQVDSKWNRNLIFEVKTRDRYGNETPFSTPYQIGGLNN